LRGTASSGKGFIIDKSAPGLFSRTSGFSCKLLRLCNLSGVAEKDG
jgi:hypothetical protein